MELSHKQQVPCLCLPATDLIVACQEGHNVMDASGPRFCISEAFKKTDGCISVPGATRPRADCVECGY